MKYGYIGFAYTKNEWIAKAISWFTKSKWSHSFITIPPMLDKEMVMEAVKGGVEVDMFERGYRNNHNQRYEIYKFNCNKSDIDSAIIVCANHLQESYGFLQYPWFMWRSLNKLFGKDIKDQNNWSSRGEVCSDLTRRFIEGSGHKELFKEYGTDSATAQDIYEIVKNNPQLFELIEKKD
jgi:hypothetical protein